MEHVTVREDADYFNKVVHEGLKEGGDVEFVIKPNATAGGNPAVAITFTVQLPDGNLARAQAVTTLAALLMGLKVASGIHSRLTGEYF